MEIRIQSVKFDADVKLTNYINRKVEKLSRYLEGRIIAANVTLSLTPDHANKQVSIQLDTPGHDLRAERHAKTFESAVVQCVEVLKIQIKKLKGKWAEQ
ncbi:MAG: HPF/RaiA family ribosome-associated protein [Bacteroidales bacterium]|nr:HPF/RaiA family ribosome-associated protein [Bacteroidales bacterium]MCL2132874.1 HPF/RaiA family ribosome-associated protein [Bacteroidales bacterium]